jgi:sulfur carrier protein
MRIVLNGEVRDVAARNLADLASELGLPERGVAIARNDEIVPRGVWGVTQLNDGDRVELVSAVQGGAR